MAKMFVSLSDNTCANDVIHNDVTENYYAIDSWMNMHTLLASRPNVVASTRRCVFLFVSLCMCDRLPVSVIIIPKF